MAIDYHNLRNWKFEDRIDRYTARDCMIYALGLGYGSDPIDENELRYVHEEQTAVVPTFLATIGAPNGWAADPATGIDWLKILHGEHRMTFHAPMAAHGAVRSTTRVSRVVDKGAGKGALVVTIREITDAETGKPLATVEHVSFCRADGGFGQGDEAPEALPGTPERVPDQVVLLSTLPQQALLYRLNGDLNPVHVLPHMARTAGFDRPILHGLCTYGMAARALLQIYAPTAPERLTGIAARFSSPVFPGESLRTEVWRDGSRLQFRVLAHERDKVVLSNGVASLAQ
ncbi:MaoC/PaaZ C-terminal domain-containing protein [Herbaspirillum sp. GCM10030257]|uniref:MaoC/PaaZ C-terminal domain-containing protein n=1 Tax=Herbaspirillum sp. GCM10030257 TaxID=3273393 RepID=UPI003616E9C9